MTGQTTQSPLETIHALSDELTGEVERIRVQIRHQKERRRELENASIPKSEYIARFEEWVDREAERFEPEKSTRHLRRPGGDFASVFRMKVGTPPMRVVDGMTDGAVADVDTGPLMCFLFGDVIKERLVKEIQAADYPEGPPAADRPQLFEGIDVELDRLELEEERIIDQADQADQAGIPINRRPDARPEIVLALPEEV